MGRIPCMANPEHLEILKQGVKAWNQWRKEHPKIQPNLRRAELDRAKLRGAKLSGADLSGANLREANLSRADLGWANLSRANLSGVNLSGAHLNGADLRKADLNGADLSEANLIWADLCGADLNGANFHRASLDCADLSRTNLSEANLMEASLFEAILSEANLSGANLVQAILYYVNLIGANLENTNLFYAHLICCDLTDAVVENAMVMGTHIEELKGLPKPPSRIWLDPDGENVLTGEAARMFFNQPVVVEVFLTHPLTHFDIGVYYCHVGEFKAKTGSQICLSSHRQEGSGTVLHFQAETYEEIYQALPDLLAPFPYAQAVDWRQTIEQIPDEERSEAFKALITLQSDHQKQFAWRYAKQIAEYLEDFRNVHICGISEFGKAKGIRIEIFENPKMAKTIEKQLAALGAPQNPQITFVQTGDKSQVTIGETHMNTQVKTIGDGNIVNAGDNARQTVHDVNITITKTVKSSKLDPQLKKALTQLHEIITSSEIPEPARRQVLEKLPPLVVELEKDKPDRRRLSRTLNFIKKMIPDFTAEAVIELIKKWPGSPT